MSNVLEIIPLGGIGEFGMNCTLMRCGDETMILEGLWFLGRAASLGVAASIQPNSTTVSHVKYDGNYHRLAPGLFLDKALEGQANLFLHDGSIYARLVASSRDRCFDYFF